MENRKFVKFSIFALGIFLIFPFFVSAYNDKTTHPALTGEIVNLFNHYYPDSKIFEDEKALIKKGSTDEDIAPRWMQHFYDPVYSRGLVLGIEWKKSKDWSQDILAQAEYDPVFVASLGIVTRKLFSSGTDYSWERAIYEYTWGNKERGLESLGHILHLLEDATVPEHTRNDVHLPVFGIGSPYEDWTSQFNDKNLDLSDKLIKENKKPIILSSLNQYFDINAVYSNNNFFSKDTILIEKYNKPGIKFEKGEILRNSKSFIFAYNENNDGVFRIAGRFFRFDWQKEIEKDDYLINDPDYLILTDYWNFLSRQAVLSGVGVVKLFFDEVAKEKKSKILLSKNTSLLEQSANKLAAIVNSVQTAAIGMWNELTGNEQSSIIVQSLPTSPASPASQGGQVGNSGVESPQTSPSSATVGNPTSNAASTPPPPVVVAASAVAPSAPPIPSSNPNPNSSPAPNNFTPSLPSPGFGGGSSPVSPRSQTPSSVIGVTATTSTATTTTDITPPFVSFTAPVNGATVFGSAVVVSADASDDIEVAGVQFKLDEQNLGAEDTSSPYSTIWDTTSAANGSHDLAAVARDTSGNYATSTAIIVTVNNATVPPDISFSISECGQSLSPDGCLLTASTTLHLSWQSSSGDLDYFELIIASQTGTTTSTSTNIFVSDNSINNFSIRAIDKSGNPSEPRTISVEISTMPVVINEIAWAGTAASSYDEWIELYNRTSKTINLNNWVLATQNQKPYIVLSSSTPAHGYYLLERKDDETVSDVPADLVYGNDGSDWALNNDPGEILILSYASTTIDKTVLQNGRWPAGNGNTTMERYDPDVAGTDPDNWGYNNTLIQNGKDVAGGIIHGTPKARNSVNYLINKGISSPITSDITLKKSNSPYLVNNQIQIFSSSTPITLTIEPGVVIKFYNEAGLIFADNAKIIAQGATGDDKQIVFTSFSDDTYGGDLDATSSAPVSLAPGNWFNVTINQSGGEGSIFGHTIFRYGGKYCYGKSRANLFVQNVSATIATSTFEYSDVYGLKLDNSNSIVSGNVFRHNNNEGMLIEGGNGALIQNNTFLENKTGLTLYDSPAIVSGNYFASSSVAAIYSGGRLPAFTNNSGSANGINGIVITGNLTRQDETATLKPNPLAYVLDSNAYATVVSSSTLIIGPGTVVKGSWGSRLDVNGNLLIQGSKPTDIIFTSLSDTPHSGDWRGINANLGSVTDIKGATFSYADKAIYYHDSPIKLEKVRFENNNWAVWADPVPVAISASMVEIENLGNLATTSPPGLWR